jgi:hypothetical protein
VTRNDLVVLRGRMQAALVALDAAITAFDQRCATCHRRSLDLAECSDGQLRGPKCRSDFEAAAGVQLPIAGGES